MGWGFRVSGVLAGLGLAGTRNSEAKGQGEGWLRFEGSAFRVVGVQRENPQQL